jgi:methylaspartate mutase epsilon subunit
MSISSCLQFLEPSCDLLPSTIDAYTRLNHYEKAAEGIERSVAAGTSLLNGFPAVNHGLPNAAAWSRR